MKKYNPKEIAFTKYLFFTGKGGVGKTSIACATAINFADNGKKVFLVSTDPASNLQDVFSMELTSKGTPIEGAPNLVVANLDPLKSAQEYKESVVAPYRGLLPDAALKNMEEQLSGACTVEVAAFNEFSHFITDKEMEKEYDYIIFDTAPTGHTLRFLQLPSAWSNFVSTNVHGASCLGQLAGLEAKKEIYKQAMNTLTDGAKTTLVLVSRPEEVPLIEADRASNELKELKVDNQMFVVNGVLEAANDKVSTQMKQKQEKALENMPASFVKERTYYLPLRAYNITGLENIRAMIDSDKLSAGHEKVTATIQSLGAVIGDVYTSGKKVIFTMGKGGVGKTTIAAAIALGLASKGLKVHLATTDPAAHLKFTVDKDVQISFSSIDEKEELKRYSEEVLSTAKKGGASQDDLDYLEEDLRSPCTQEIAVFRAFAEIVDKADTEFVVIDTAPTGHTLLLLDSTQSYHREVKRSTGIIPESVKKLLPRLTNEKETEVIIVTLAETTPVYEALRLSDDLKRANITAKWWVINSSLYRLETENAILKAKSLAEHEWINKVFDISNGNLALVKWKPEAVKGANLLALQN